MAWGKSIAQFYSKISGAVKCKFIENDISEDYLDPLKYRAEPRMS
jgi:hypothetical protein